MKNVGSGWFVGQQKLRWPAGWLVGGYVRRASVVYCWSAVSICSVGRLVGKLAS